MRYASIAHVLGILLAVTGGAMLLPLACSWLYREDDLLPLLYAALVTMGMGLALKWRYRRNLDLSIKDGIVIAVFGWIMVSAFSALPFMFHGSVPSFTDGFFEMMSGYTTTGATILTDIESLPHGLLFWRSQTSLMGGMGFLTLTVLFLPHGVGGLRLFRAESSPGQVITGEKFKARNRDSMVRLWWIYIGLNLVQTLLMIVGGMSLFDALCTAFATVSTSGYSPRNAGIGFYDSAFIDWVIIVFMLLGGTSFILLYMVRLGDWKAIRINTELRWYLIVTFLFCAGVAFFLWQDNIYTGARDSIRYACFQVVSILTTTGFTTADYELWPQAAQMFLYVVCFVGACAGSTSSGIKIVHYVILCKYIYGTVRKIFFQPMAVVTVRLNERPVEASVIDLAVCYFIINIFVVLLGGCFMAIVDNMDYVTAMSSVISCLMNIGPGFGDVGPTENYAFVSDVGKWFLSWNMLLGRLEMFSVLAVFYPSFWKK